MAERGAKLALDGVKMVLDAKVMPAEMAISSGQPLPQPLPQPYLHGTYQGFPVPFATPQQLYPSQQYPFISPQGYPYLQPPPQGYYPYHQGRPYP